MSPTEIQPIYARTFKIQPRKGDLRRFAIIQAAVHCLSEDAMEGGVFDRIGKRLRIRRTLVGYYFKSKDDLLEAAVQYVIATAQQMTIEKVQLETTAEGRVLAMVDAAFDWAEKHPEQARVLTLFLYSCGTKKSHRNLNSLIRNGGYERLVAILGGLPLQGGAVRSQSDIELLARSLQVELSGYVIESFTTRATGMRELAKESCRLRLADYLLRK